MNTSGKTMPRTRAGGKPLASLHRRGAAFALARYNRRQRSEALQALHNERSYPFNTILPLLRTAVLLTECWAVSCGPRNSSTPGQGPFKMRGHGSLAWLPGMSGPPFEKGSTIPSAPSAQPSSQKKCWLFACDLGLTPAPPSAQLLQLSAKALGLQGCLFLLCWPWHQISFPTLQ